MSRRRPSPLNHPITNHSISYPQITYRPIANESPAIHSAVVAEKSRPRPRRRNSPVAATRWVRSTRAPPAADSARSVMRAKSRLWRPNPMPLRRMEPHVRPASNIEGAPPEQKAMHEGLLWLMSGLVACELPNGVHAGYRLRQYFSSISSISSSLSPK